MEMKTVAAMMLFLLFTGPARAEAPTDLYKTANALYAEGKFADASDKYQSALAGGLQSWVVDFNLGNAYYRAGQLGKAILHYERAFRRHSAQGDVIYNLNLATTKAGDPELPTTALAVLAWRLFYLLPINALTLATTCFFLVLAVWLGSLLVGKSVLRGDFAVAVSVVFGILAVWLGVRISILEKPEGVVVAPVAEVRSGPNTTYPANFTVPEGRRVLILKEQEPIQGWLEIGVPQEGLKGWVPDTSVEVI